MEIKYVFIKNIFFVIVALLFPFVGQSEVNKNSANHKFLKDSVLVLTTKNNALSDIVTGIKSEIGLR